MKDGLRWILQKWSISNSAISDDYNAESGHTSDEKAYANALYDYITYNTSTKTKHTRPATSITGTEYINMFWSSTTTTKTAMLQG